MKTNPMCRVCEVELNDDNWYPSYQKGGSCICKECNREYYGLYSEANRNKIDAQNSLYRAANRDKINERECLWRINNLEKAKASSTKNHRDNGVLSMNENKECSAYLGVHINERMLRHLFNDVEVMPYGNPGYDFICNHGKKIDGKSSCLHKNGCWSFAIKHNTTADYFLLVAYDNRKDLNPLHIWLIPGHVLNHLTCTTISPSTIDKWAEYEQDISEVIICCEEIRND